MIPHRDFAIECQFCKKKLIEVKFDPWFGTTIDYGEYQKAERAVWRMAAAAWCEECDAIYQRICREAWPLE